MPVSKHDPETVRRRAGRSLVALAAALLAVVAPAGPALAQITTVDPDAAIDADLNPAPAATQTPAPAPSGELPSQQPAAQATGNGTPIETESGVADWKADQLGAPAPGASSVPPVQDTSSTYREDDLIGAAEGVFGKGAKGLADLIKDLLAKQGEPNAYIVGREAGGALAVGLRYGSGTLHHKVEGEQPVYWTGPSIGFDAGANAASAFVLVYNLYDSEDLFHRFGAGEGQAYLVGGFTVSYLRRGNIVLIPVRAGAGLRLGANIGYMKFSHKQRWLPF
ncbi:DUF1134 domain-containing protein [Novosphingobium naphthalenivorans]|uniref:DUF1134 domain-containing protein n=1 Tax=Novosphingobium naphthalenivorans TaxID=273168 RepID=UPI0008340980|nr:DUF1134 domain-containing protein [Novosphingobium naphthalenivorans]